MMREVNVFQNQAEHSNTLLNTIEQCTQHCQACV